VLAAFWRLRRTWTDAAEPAALALPLAVALAVTASPPPRAGLATGTVFHLAARPAAYAVGDERAVRLVVAVAAASALLLAYALSRSAGLDPVSAVIGQAALPVLPVLAFGIGPALYVHALPQALELLLLTHLVRRFDHLEGARDNAGAFAYLLLAQAAGPVTTLEVALVVAVLAGAAAASGRRRRALRLATSWAASAALVLSARTAAVWMEWPPRTVRVPLAAGRPFAMAMTAVIPGLLAVWLLPRTTLARQVLGSALVAGLLAAVIAWVTAFAPGAMPGMGLLAPSSAAGAAAVAARIRNRRTAAAPGSRS
jgi:hypothetical protein